jgi:hypothetical protein
LHWQVMDAAHAHLARGLPVRYAPYLRNGLTTSERPDRGDRIEAIVP